MSIEFEISHEVIANAVLDIDDEIYIQELQHRMWENHEALQDHVDRQYETFAFQEIGDHYARGVYFAYSAFSTAVNNTADMSVAITPNDIENYRKHGDFYLSKANSIMEKRLTDFHREVTGNFMTMSQSDYTAFIRGVFDVAIPFMVQLGFFQEEL